MPYLSEKIKLPKGLDRRIKLTDEDKIEIRKRYFESREKFFRKEIGEVISQRSLAREYGVSRRTIVWVLYPERLERNKELREKRGGWRRYYNKEKNTIAIRRTRNYKQKLYLEGLLSIN